MMDSKHNLHAAPGCKGWVSALMMYQSLHRDQLVMASFCIIKGLYLLLNSGIELLTLWQLAWRQWDCPPGLKAGIWSNRVRDSLSRVHEIVLKTEWHVLALKRSKCLLPQYTSDARCYTRVSRDLCWPRPMQMPYNAMLRAQRLWDVMYKKLTGESESLKSLVEGLLG